MKVCPQCGLAMRRTTGAGGVAFECHCGLVCEGGAEDARVAGDVLHAGETEEMYRRLIRNAAHDLTNQQVKKECPACSLDYMTQVRVGHREAVVFVCKCGYDSTREASASP